MPIFDACQAISLLIGVQLRIQVQGLHHHFKGYMVGFEPGEYIIVNTPQVGYLKFTRGKPVVVRFLHRGKVLMFRSRWIGSILNPRKLIFLEHPERIEEHERRSEKRFECFLAAKIGLSGEERHGVIRDISEGGCRLVIKSVESLEDERLPALEMGRVIPLTFQLPGIKDDQMVSGEIRNFQTDSQGMALGIQFHGLASDVKNRISQYISTLELF